MENTDLLNAVRSLLRLVLFICVLLFVGMIRIYFQQDDSKSAINDTAETVNDVQSFVNELREPPSQVELDQQAAVTQAVRLVPAIKDILCEEFPDANGCQE